MFIFSDVPSEHHTYTEYYYYIITGPASSAPGRHPDENDVHLRGIKVPPTGNPCKNDLHKIYL